MPNNELPQRDPLTGPPRAYTGPPAEVVECFAAAVREWAEQPPETSRCRGELDSSGIGNTNPLDTALTALAECTAWELV